jgi:hypothetical protein
MNEVETDVSLPVLTLEPCDTDTKLIGIAEAEGHVANMGRLRELNRKLRTEHLNGQERIPLLKICEEYSDIFHLPGDKLTITTAMEHAIPTPGVSTYRGIASRNYRIPEALKGELKLITEQMLEDKIIRHSTSPWNWPIILVKKGRCN